MDRPTLSDGFPVLVADIPQAAELDFLDGVALSRGIAFLPLMFAPRTKAEHVLEVYTPGAREPRRFFAMPAGEAKKEGFPLTLRHYAGSTGDSQPKAESRGRESLVGTALAGGKLRLESLLGAGAVGAVYRATHRELQKTVAVKVLLSGASASKEFCQRFEAEAQAASRLDHANLTRVLDFGQEPDGLLYLSMEYLDGFSLEEVLGLEGQLLPARAVSLMEQVCAGLWHAHARSIIHRDIKPANIVLVHAHDDDGEPMELVKVCDFGIAAQTAKSGDRDVSGTPEYMAPEALMGEQADGRADLYACGVMLFELVTGRLPFERESVRELAIAHINEAPPRPSQFVRGVEPALEAIILKALAKSPGDRFASVRELRNALKELGATSTSDAPQSRPALSGERPKAAPTSGRADWLEDPSETYGNFLMSAASPQGGAYHEAELLAAEVAKAPMEFLNALATHRATPTFADEVDRLEMAVAALAKRGDATSLGCVVRVFSAIYAEEVRRIGAAATAMGPGARAFALLQSLGSPTNLKPLAERLLSEPEPGEDVGKLLAWASGVGARALYAARLTQHRVNHLSAAARERFVSLMRRIGGPAAPVLREGLSQLLPAGERDVSDPQLACDLLRALPHAADPTTADLALRYARDASTEVAAAALETLAFSAPDKARPLLADALSSDDVRLKVSALRSLRVTAGIDEATVRILGALVDGTDAAPEEVRIAAAEALASPTSAARATATRILLGALARGSTVMALVRGARPSDELVLASAQTALALSPGDATDIVRMRAQKSPDPLRSKLLSLVAK